MPRPLTTVATIAGTTFSATGTGTALFVRGGFNIALGPFVGTIKLQRQDSAGNWLDVSRDSAGTLLSWSSGGFALSWEERGQQGAFYRLVCVALTSGTPYCELSS